MMFHNTTAPATPTHVRFAIYKDVATPSQIATGSSTPAGRRTPLSTLAISNTRAVRCATPKCCDSHFLDMLNWNPDMPVAHRSPDAGRDVRGELERMIPIEMANYFGEEAVPLTPPRAELAARFLEANGSPLEVAASTSYDHQQDNRDLEEFLTALDAASEFNDDSSTRTFECPMSEFVTRLGDVVSVSEAEIPAMDEIDMAARPIQTAVRGLLARRLLAAKRAAISAATAARTALAAVLRAVRVAAKAADDAARRRQRQRAAIARHLRRAQAGRATTRSTSVWR